MLAQKIEMARQSGVPEAPLQRWAESRRAEPSGFSGPLAPDRELVDGVTVDTDLGAWTVVRDARATRPRTWCSTSRSAGC